MANLLIGPKGILLLSHWPCIRISYYSLSLATCHPIECRPNIVVADGDTVWVCKCLQLIHLSALSLTHLESFRIYLIDSLHVSMVSKRFEAYENRSVAFSFVETKFSVCKIISGNALCCLNKLTVSVQQCFVAIWLIASSGKKEYNIFKLWHETALAEHCKRTWAGLLTLAKVPSASSRKGGPISSPMTIQQQLH